MVWLMLMGCGEQVAETVGGVPIDETTSAACSEELEEVSIDSHSNVAHLLNIAVCVDSACDLAPEPGSIKQGAARLTLDCSYYEDGAALRIRTLRIR